MGIAPVLLSKAPSPPVIPWVDGTLLFITVTTAGIIAAIWVFFDARARGIDNPALWATIIAFLFLLYALPGLAALLIYIIMRTRRPTGESS